MNVFEIEGILRRGKMSAVACEWLAVISVFVDERYENYDYDMIGPMARMRIARLLRQAGFRRLSGREFEDAKGRIVFPRPTRTLASDPAAELESVIDANGNLAFATPTQVLLVTWRREGPDLPAARHASLLALVREQPANLDKVRDWLRGTESERAFRRSRPRLEAAQQEGLEARRRRRR